ncbi:MAG: PEGA domain-containing protein [Candidatus Edwardsbacteria bacterium]
MKRTIILFLISGGLASNVSAQVKKPAIAVLPFDGRGISTDDAMALSDRLRAEVIATGAYAVMERAEMERILKEQAFQLTGACSEVSCIRQVGQLIAVTKMVGGSISKVGNLYTIEARLIDVETGTIEKNVVEDFGGQIEEFLTKIMGKVARKLAGIEGAEVSFFGENADLNVRSEPLGGMIIIDDQPTGLVTPATIKKLMASLHKVRVEKGDLAKDTTITLKPNLMGTVDLNLVKRCGKLKIEGEPAGAWIVMNDSIKMGFLPLKPKEIPFGQYKLKIKAKGYDPQYFELAIGKEATYSLTANLKRKSRLGAGLRSLILPGWGQRYSGRKGMGWVYLCPSMLGLASTTVSFIGYNFSMSQYEKSKRNYEAAKTTQEAVKLCGEMNWDYKNALDWYNQLRYSAVVTAGLWGWNFLDALILFPGKPKVRLESDTKAEGNIKTSISLTFNW